MNEGIGTASWIELAWLACGIVAYACSMRTYRSAKRKRETLTRAGVNGRYMLAANRNIREERLRVLKSVVIITVGLVASATPPPAHLPPVTPVGVALTVGLFLISAFITWGAISSSRYYARFDEYAGRLRRSGDIRPPE